MKLKFNKAINRDGTQAPDLIDVVLQNKKNKKVLFCASMNKKALSETKKTGRVVLYSKSRKCLWCKGSTSGDWLKVGKIYVNCENNCLLIKTIPQGKGVCHVKDKKGKAKVTCFFRKIK
jgi:phosphoribosyl-AMP cyclohydrolase